MCFVLAFVSLALSVNFFVSGHFTYAFIWLGAASFFFYLMIRNIIHVKKKRREKKETQHDH